MLCGAAALASCNLDTIPTDKYTVETFWETEEGTEAAMTGCYNILTNSALFGDSAPLLEETCTPNAYNYNNAGGYNVIAQGTCLLYTSPSPRDVEESRMPSSA